MGKLDEALNNYHLSLAEKNDPAIKEMVKKMEEQKKVQEEKAYIDPAKAEEQREKGNKLFNDLKYPEAIKEYTDGIKRDSNNSALFLNRAVAYCKLLEWGKALDDIAKCLSLDPNKIKAYAKKGSIHYVLKEYHRSVEAYDKGLQLDPNNQECQEGKAKTMMSAQTQEVDDDRYQRGMSDPEIQYLLKDPRMS